MWCLSDRCAKVKHNVVGANEGWRALDLIDHLCLRSYCTNKLLPIHSKRQHARLRALDPGRYYLSNRTYYQFDWLYNEEMKIALRYRSAAALLLSISRLQKNSPDKKLVFNNARCEYTDIGIDPAFLVSERRQSKPFRQWHHVDSEIVFTLSRWAQLNPLWQAHTMKCSQCRCNRTFSSFWSIHLTQ